MSSVKPLEPHTHATPLSLAFDLDEAGEGELDDVHEALLSCEVCHRALETLGYWLSVLDHWSPRVGPEFLTRHRQMGDLFARPTSHAQRLHLAHSDTLFHQWGLCRLLLEQSRQASSGAPSHAIEFAELALAIAEALDPHFYGESWVADLRTDAAVLLAGLHRTQKSFEQAEAFFRLALGWSKAGTGRREVPAGPEHLESLFIRDSHPQTALQRSFAQLASDSDTAALPGPVHQLLHRRGTASSSA